MVMEDVGGYGNAWRKKVRYLCLGKVKKKKINGRHMDKQTLT